MEKLDIAVDAMPATDRERGAEAIRKLLAQHHRELTAQDEKVLSAFVEGWVGLSELSEQFEGRI
ncbi:hypothetical protein [Variovorax sp. KBW07]|uniref:hypothetical protein n=1 Tax=Variovorax sp. KBW07 TaxID=2153358 RepID=UPI000F56BC89|nr:hypothetical protein [Variovorax sp. KBW07]